MSWSWDDNPIVNTAKGVGELVDVAFEDPKLFKEALEYGCTGHVDDKEKVIVNGPHAQQLIDELYDIGLNGIKNCKNDIHEAIKLLTGTKGFEYIGELPTDAFDSGLDEMRKWSFSLSTQLEDAVNKMKNYANASGVESFFASAGMFSTKVAEGFLRFGETLVDGTVFVIGGACNIGDPEGRKKVKDWVKKDRVGDMEWLNTAYDCYEYYGGMSREAFLSQAGVIVGEYAAFDCAVKGVVSVGKGLLTPAEELKAADVASKEAIAAGENATRVSKVTMATSATKTGVTNVATKIASSPVGTAAKTVTSKVGSTTIGKIAGTGLKGAGNIASKGGSAILKGTQSATFAPAYVAGASTFGGSAQNLANANPDMSYGDILLSAGKDGIVAFGTAALLSKAGQKEQELRQKMGLDNTKGVRKTAETEYENAKKQYDERVNEIYEKAKASGETDFSKINEQVSKDPLAQQYKDSMNRFERLNNEYSGTNRQQLVEETEFKISEANKGIEQRTKEITEQLKAEGKSETAIKQRIAKDPEIKNFKAKIEGEQKVLDIMKNTDSKFVEQAKNEKQKYEDKYTERAEKLTDYGKADGLSETEIAEKINTDSKLKKYNDKINAADNKITSTRADQKIFSEAQDKKYTTKKAYENEVRANEDVYDEIKSNKKDLEVLEEYKDVKIDEKELNKVEKEMNKYANNVDKANDKIDKLKEEITDLETKKATSTNEKDIKKYDQEINKKKTQIGQQEKNITNNANRLSDVRTNNKDLIGARDYRDTKLELEANNAKLEKINEAKVNYKEAKTDLNNFIKDSSGSTKIYNEVTQKIGGKEFHYNTTTPQTKVIGMGSVVKNYYDNNKDNIIDNATSPTISIGNPRIGEDKISGVQHYHIEDPVDQEQGFSYKNYDNPSQSPQGGGQQSSGGGYTGPTGGGYTGPTGGGYTGPTGGGYTGPTGGGYTGPTGGGSSSQNREDSSSYVTTNPSGENNPTNPGEGNNPTNPSGENNPTNPGGENNPTNPGRNNNQNQGGGEIYNPYTPNNENTTVHTGGGYTRTGGYSSSNDNIYTAPGGTNTITSAATKGKASIDDIVKGSKYTKIPTNTTPIKTNGSSGLGNVIPIAAGLSAAAAAGIGAKAYLDHKKNNDNDDEFDIDDDKFNAEEWNGDENNLEIDYDDSSDKVEEQYLDDDDEFGYQPETEEKYGARNNEELADLQ